MNGTVRTTRNALQLARTIGLITLVPNVVYSCGGIVHDGVLWLPYGASDVRVGFATIPQPPSSRR
ncbi:hypothetical protein [Dactylosporangium sp. NPDC049140]|uniref:hypothetical protein n=1 Tax=Dactylosporangium sp. NPDC049140 TaxID=3155647 RepID=UPI0033D4881E